MTGGSEEIVVSNLTKHYKELRAVDDLSFSVRPGRVTGFLGPNGAGKTTTLRMLLGLVTPDRRHGHLRRRPLQDLDRADPARRRGARGVQRAQGPHRPQPPADDLRGGRAARQAADEALALVGLTPAAKRKFKGYSLGMKQRLGIAAAMLGDPRVLILDEPANGLDPEGIRWMRDLLKALAAEGRTVLVSSHLLGEMQQLADDVVIVAAGQLIRQGPVDEVLGSMAGRRQVRVRTPQAERADRGAAPSSRRRSPPLPDGALLVTGLDAAAIGHAAFTASVELHELTGERADLEQVFLQLTAGKAGIR